MGTETPETEIPESSSPLQASRRRVMIAGGTSLLAIGGLAACGSSDDSTGGDSSGDDTAAAPSAAASSDTSSGSGASTPLIALAKVPDGGAVAVTSGNLQLIVARPSGSDPVAFSSVCPHQGCTVAPNGANLKCPCHQSMFGLNGAKVSGPAPTGLITYEVAVEGDQVVLKSDTPGAPAA